jgi:hypothetical protein
MDIFKVLMQKRCHDLVFVLIYLVLIEVLKVADQFTHHGLLISEIGED